MPARQNPLPRHNTTPLEALILEVLGREEQLFGSKEDRGDRKKEMLEALVAWLLTP